MAWERDYHPYCLVPSRIEEVMDRRFSMLDWELTYLSLTSWTSASALKNRKVYRCYPPSSFTSVQALLATCIWLAETRVQRFHSMLLCTLCSVGVASLVDCKSGLK